MAKGSMYLGKAPGNKYFRVSRKNLDIIPKSWKIYRNRDNYIAYNHKTGRVTDKYVAVKELKTERDVQEFSKMLLNDIDLLFGYFQKAL